MIIALALSLTACVPFTIRIPLLEGTTEPAGTPVAPGETLVPVQPANLTPAPTAIPPPTATPIPPTPIPTPTATSTPVPPLPIQVALAGEPETLHPLYAQSLAARTVLGALLIGCAGADENGLPVALGCERIPNEQNGDAKYVGQGLDRSLEVTFRIREGWRWTDGTPVTSQDAVYAWQLVMAPQTQTRDRLAQMIYSVKPNGPRAAIVRFMSAGQARAAAAGTLRGDVPFEFFSSLGDYAAYAKQETPLSDPLYWAALRWLPAHLLKDIKPADQARSTYGRKPVGDGAFELVDWAPGARITLARAKAPFVLAPVEKTTQLTFLIARDDAAALALVAAGDAQLGPLMARTLVERAPGASLTRTVAGPAPLFEQITLNAERPPLDEPNVRLAVALALQGAPEVLAASGGPLEAPILFNLEGGVFRSSAPLPVSPDAGLAAARDALRSGGWSCAKTPCERAVTTTNRAGAVTAVTTRTLQFSLITNEREPRTLLTQAIQRRLAQAGIALDVQIVFGLGPASRLFWPADQGGVLANRAFDAALYQLPSIRRLSSAFACASIPNPKTGADGGNVAGLCDPKLDALIRTAEQGPGLLRPGQPNPDAQAAIEMASRANVIVPLYAAPVAYPNRGVRGVRLSGWGILTWNAWEWERISAP